MMNQVHWLAGTALGLVVDLARTGLVVALLIPGCARQGARPEQVAFGEWRVTGSFCPSECAMGAADAAAWRERTATYGDSLVRFADVACRSPRYGVAYWPADGQYGGARLADMGITGDSALVIEVRCGDQPQVGSDPRWQVPGAFLIVKNQDHVLTPWDGIFFELTRQ